MAAWILETQYPDVEVLGGSRTRDVQTIGIRTKEHGVYFEFRLPRANATTARIRSAADVWTLTLEAIFDYAGVSDVQWTQEPTPSGLLEDHFLVYVTSTSGDSESVLDIPLSKLTTDTLQAQVPKLRKSLDATEAL